MNKLETRPPTEKIEIQKPSETLARYNVNIVTDLGDTVQATGPRYHMKDIKCAAAVNVGKLTSGVLCE